MNLPPVGARHQRQALVWLLHFALFSLAAAAAFLLRFDYDIPGHYLGHMRIGVAMLVVSKVLAFAAFRLNHGWWRFVSIHDVARLAAANAAGSVWAAFGIQLLAPKGFPRSIYLLDFVLCLLITAGVRVAVRLALDVAARQRPHGRTTLIYGAGSAGVRLHREIRSNPNLPYNVIGFLDDNPEKSGILINGVPVFGGGAKLWNLVEQRGIEEVLIAIPAASGPDILRILAFVHEAGVACRTIPSLSEILCDRALTSQIREVAVEDLLRRAQVDMDLSELGRQLRDKVVLVTGAAGSIGSEICRQVARFSPRLIIGFDAAETPLFELDLEMRKKFPTTEFLPAMGTVQNRRRIEELLAEHRPSVLYHAAAYKHVPMMEGHIIEAVENNVLGTMNVAIAARGHGVSDFVMISTDKAVRPTNVMGATKRLAELVILSLGGGATKFVSVRFGNVLGSNGSVVPIFKRQIAAGGPVEVTHPEMRRYFMTIPEAVQLTMQAGVMGHEDEIFVLDMGEPVRIVDLARDLILLSGFRLSDIRIDFTGTRPGEKLYEELMSEGEGIGPTQHPKIRTFVGRSVPAEEMARVVEDLQDCCQSRNIGRLLKILEAQVVDYQPSLQIQAKANCWTGQLHQRRPAGSLPVTPQPTVPTTVH